MKDGKLESKDLMIGDWVLEGGTIPRKVKHLGDGQIDSMMEECYSPIYLTAEILEKNEITYFGDFSGEGQPCRYKQYRLCLDTGKVKIEQDQNDGTFILFIFLHGVNMIIDFTSVHELQHALRLCGLTELADRFKVL